LYGSVLACFAAQVLLIVLLGERGVPSLKAIPFATSVHLVSDPWSMEQLAAFTELSDPSVFALPSAEGFSRAGWLTYKLVSDEFAESPEKPRWLQVDPQALGRELAAFLATNAAPPIRLGDQSMPESLALQPRPSAELNFPQSELRIGGALAQRKLLTPVQLPPQPHGDVLTSSVVHLLVDADGAPISTALVSGSGSKEADKYALAATKRLRFKPERTRQAVTSGTASFFWQTLPPQAATNILSPGLTPP
jgi:TonB family protein